MEFFEVGTGVRQGCIHSPFLFAMVMDCMLKRALDRPDFGITWRSQYLTDIDFADDVALLEDISMLQQMITSLGTKGSNFGLRISGETSKIMHIGLSLPTKPVIVGQSQLEKADVFQYLASNIASNGKMDSDISSRCAKAAVVYHRLQHVWVSSTIRLHTKLCLYISTVVPIALYGSETWKFTASIIQKLDVFIKGTCMVSLKSPGMTNEK